MPEDAVPPPTATPPTPSTPSSEGTSAASPAPLREEKDILQTPPVEAEEIEEFIQKGSNAHNTVGILTLVGVLILIGALLYFERLDVIRHQRAWVDYPALLQEQIENQVRKDQATYVVRRGQGSQTPIWPLQLYRKLRFDLYLVAGFALLLALVFIHIEKAKLQRNDLLLYRSLAREIEKLRLRLKELEKNRPPTPPSSST